ncbi:MAG TPA: TIR domain-containing protein [Gemmatimonadaceae bacterium]
MRVFLSWAGPTSKAVALALRKWLPAMIQHAKPWMSDEDIHAGDRWASKVGGELEKSSFGIICLTPTNPNQPWIHFESGALSKVATRSRVVPYLLGLEKTDVSGPLTQFQMVRADLEGTFKLLQSVNSALNENDRLTDGTLDAVFEVFWPKLDEELGSIRQMMAAELKQPTRRDAADMLDELLELARAQERRAKDQERRAEEQYRNLFSNELQKGLLERISFKKTKPLLDMLSGPDTSNSISTVRGLLFDVPSSSDTDPERDERADVGASDDKTS